MFPFRGSLSFTADDKVDSDSEVNNDEVFSTNDVFENVHCFEHNFELDNIDPSLFCPDIILELGDTPIFINNDQPNSNQYEDKDSILKFRGPEEKNEKSSVTLLDLTTEEIGVMEKTFDAANPVQYTKVHCTACNDHLGSALSDHDNRFVHPLLRVLICKECYEFYISGEFEKEDDGSEIYCRWCGQGGHVVCCSKCEFVFCTSCIRNNLGRKKLSEIKGNDDWTCFNCDPSQITDIRRHCAQLMEYVKKETSRIRVLANVQSLMKTDYSKCCLNLENVAIEKNKKIRKSPVDPTYNPHKNQNPSRRAPPSNKSLLTGNHVARESRILAPKGISTSSIGNTVSDNRNSTASVEIRNRSVFPLPIIKPLNKPSSSPNLYIALPSLPQIETLPNGEKVIISDDKTQQTSRNTPALVPFQKTTTTGQEDLRHKKLFYARSIRSTTNINSDLSRELTRLREGKGADGAAGLEGMVVVHNKLQDVLNKSINSLVRIHKELAECKPGNSNIKYTLGGFNNKSPVVKGLQNVIITTGVGNKGNKMEQPPRSTF